MADKVVRKCMPMITGITLFYCKLFPRSLFCWHCLYCCHVVLPWCSCTSTTKELPRCNWQELSLPLSLGLCCCWKFPIKEHVGVSSLYTLYWVYICMLTRGMLMSTEPSCFVLVLNFEFHIGIVVYIFKGSVLLPKSCFF